MQPHPSAAEHLPWFLPGADGSDPLFTFATLSVIGAITLIGVLFFTLHSLPERLGHKKLQFELVAVLGLLSLLTHVHAFWVAALILAVIDLPDFLTPLKRMSQALERLAGIEAPQEEVKAPDDAAGHPTPAPADTVKPAEAV